MLVLQVFHLREQRFESRQLLVGPAHTQEVDVVAALAVVVVALLKLYAHETEKKHGVVGEGKTERGRSKAREESREASPQPSYKYTKKRRIRMQRCTNGLRQGEGSRQVIESQIKKIYNHCISTTGSQKEFS